MTTLQSRGLTECTICLKALKMPKVLTCDHTFCLECLQLYVKDETGSTSFCPICKRVFSIPFAGVQDLPNNFFIDRLMHIDQSKVTRKLTERTSCELCSESDSETAATSCCVECDQEMCDRCAMIHRKQRLSKSHKIVRIDDKPSAPKKRKMTRSYCKYHLDKQIELYCYDCKVTSCTLCHVKDHNKHACTDVNTATAEFRKQLKVDLDRIAVCCVQNEASIVRMNSEKDALADKINEVQNKVSEKCDELVSLIRARQCLFITELSAVKDKQLMKLNKCIDEIKQQSEIMEHFQGYCEEIQDEGMEYDISSSANGIQVRVAELVKIHEEYACHDIDGVEVIFEPSSLALTANAVTCFIGKLTTKDKGSKYDSEAFSLSAFMENPSVPLHVMHDEGSISGIAHLGNQLFVVRYSTEVTVYNSASFKLFHTVTIPDSSTLYGIVGCETYNCLYIIDPIKMILHKYDPRSDFVSNWSVGGECYGLSVTANHNVLATLYNSRQIKEYDTNGKLLRKIDLDDRIQFPKHSIELFNGNFVVCHEGKLLHRVCLIDNDGCILETFGGTPGSGVRQLKGPRHLAVDKHGHVLVTDYYNNRVRLLGPSLNYLGDIPILRCELSGPQIVHFDESRNRLYIGEWYGERLFALKTYVNDKKSKI